MKGMKVVEGMKGSRVKYRAIGLTLTAALAIADRKSVV